jgi:hypothetical protein
MMQGRARNHPFWSKCGQNLNLTMTCLQASRWLLALCVLSESTGSLSFQLFSAKMKLVTHTRAIASIWSTKIPAARPIKKFSCVATVPTTNLDAHIPIDLEYPGLRQVLVGRYDVLDKQRRYLKWIFFADPSVS